MSELFDEEYLMKQYDLSERKKSFAKGKCDALKCVAEKLREIRLSYEQIKNYICSKSNVYCQQAAYEFFMH